MILSLPLKNDSVYRIFSSPHLYGAFVLVLQPTTLSCFSGKKAHMNFVVNDDEPTGYNHSSLQFSSSKL